jgi:hypothetical protein
LGDLEIGGLGDFEDWMIWRIYAVGVKHLSLG